MVPTEKKSFHETTYAPFMIRTLVAIRAEVEILEWGVET